MNATFFLPNGIHGRFIKGGENPPSCNLRQQPPSLSAILPGVSPSREGLAWMRQGEIMKATELVNSRPIVRPRSRLRGRNPGSTPTLNSGIAGGSPVRADLLAFDDKS